MALIFKLNPLLLPMMVSLFIYIKLDEKAGLTERITAQLRIKKDWQPFYIVCILLGAGVGTGLVGIYLLPVENAAYFALDGVFAGVCLGILSQIKKKNKAE